MNKSAFLKLVQQVSNISDQQTEELEKVAATFPYCQTAHLLLAKSAYDKGSMLSTQRLRRASSYATDRQLLKRIIYTAPIEPVFEEAEAESETATHEHEVFTSQDEAAVVELVEEVQEALEEPASPETEYLEQVYAGSTVARDAESAEASEEELPTEEPEEELDPELALLLTFNSISSSSTDLLSQKNQVEESEEEPLSPAVDHYQETGEALAELNAASDDVSAATQDEQDEDDTDLYLEEPGVPEEVAASVETTDETAELVLQHDLEEEFQEEEDEHSLPANPEEAEINYTVNEIDRLYAEDALGYWMGSSRMGEVLQLKDEYTRPKPQSFHPELILEYSKTHELEKAIQPSAHVLSTQLDIIDQFLKLNPRLKTMANIKLKPEPQEDLSLKSSKIRKGTASESLAAIFLKQGKTKKALKIYEQLILKYPEKKSYFAEQIEKLQNIT